VLATGLPEVLSATKLGGVLLDQRGIQAETAEIVGDPLLVSDRVLPNADAMGTS